jgi:hypothetical protein
MLHNITSQNVSYAFSKIRNGNIIVAGTGADKDYIKFGECFQIWTMIESKTGGMKI